MHVVEPYRISIVVIDSKLVYNEKNKPPKYGQQEENLWYEHHEDVVVPLEMTGEEEGREGEGEGRGRERERRGRREGREGREGDRERRRGRGREGDREEGEKGEEE